MNPFWQGSPGIAPFQQWIDDGVFHDQLGDRGIGFALPMIDGKQLTADLYLPGMERGTVINPPAQRRGTRIQSGGQASTLGVARGSNR